MANSTAYVKMKVTDLTALLSKRGLPTSGSKIQMISRLVKQDQDTKDADKAVSEGVQRASSTYGAGAVGGIIAAAVAATGRDGDKGREEGAGAVTIGDAGGGRGARGKLKGKEEKKGRGEGRDMGRGGGMRGQKAKVYEFMYDSQVITVTMTPDERR